MIPGFLHDLVPETFGEALLSLKLPRKTTYGGSWYLVTSEKLGYNYKEAL